MEKKQEKLKTESKQRDDGVELENQFILRIPEEIATHLHEALQTGNLKDRLTIQMDNDLRYGEVRFDHWLLYAKIVDLPTIIECLKTIDRKNFYKTADICQMMLCKEDQDLESEKESPNKGKKKDPNKVDKKYLWPHGVTPPFKNVRRRRFRKTLKKKNVEAPEIEKEVKRLLRVDNEAVKVDFEIITEDVDKSSMDQHSKDYNEDEQENEANEQDKTLNEDSSQKDIDIESDNENETRASLSTMRVAQHEIFGEEVSSSDDDDPDLTRVPDLDEGTRMSADDSRMLGYFMGGGTTDHHENQNDAHGSMEFDKSMFDSPKDQGEESKYDDSNLSNPGMGGFEDEYSNDRTSQMNTEQIHNKINDLKRQFNELKMQHTQKAQEISSIQNPTLRQRMQETLDNLISQMIEKELEIKDYENML